MPNPAARVRLHPRPKRARLVFKVPRKAAPPRDGSKLAKILALTTRPTGASLGELVRISGWREHSIRAALTGIAKRNLGLRVTSAKSHDRVRRYYVTTLEKPDGKTLPQDVS